MDVNYARWMSKDPDAEPELEDEPRRLRLRWPRRSAVASTAIVSLIGLGGGALVRSIATPESSAGPETVETTIAEQHSDPGAASVDDSMPKATASTWDDPSSDGTTSDDAADHSTTEGPPAPTGPRPMDRHEFDQSNGAPPGRPWRDHPPRGEAIQPAVPPPMPWP